MIIKQAMIYAIVNGMEKTASDKPRVVRTDK